MTKMLATHRVFTIEDAKVIKATTSPDVMIKLQLEGEAIDPYICLFLHQAVLDQITRALELMILGKHPRITVTDDVKIKFKRSGLAIHDVNDVHKRHLNGADQFVFTEQSLGTLLNAIKQPTQLPHGTYSA